MRIDKQYNQVNSFSSRTNTENLDSDLDKANQFRFVVIRIFCRLAANGILLGAKSIGKVQLQSEVCLI